MPASRTSSHHCPGRRKDNLDALDESQLRQAVERLRVELASESALVDKLTHENAVLKRLKFAAKSEAFSAEQKSLLEETLDMDLAAVAADRGPAAGAQPTDEKKQPRRQPLPAHLPRREIRDEPDDTTCGCGQAMKRIGEDVAETRLRARRVHGRAPCARQVGLRLLREAGAGPRAGACDRQGHPGHRPAGAGAGGEVPGSPAALRNRGLGGRIDASWVSRRACVRMEVCGHMPVWGGQRVERTNIRGRHRLLCKRPANTG